MRKKLLSLLVLLMAVVTSAWAQEKEAYAQWDPSTTTLTFKYDANKPASDAWNLNTAPEQEPEWLNTVRNTLTKVAFDPSFAEARPTTFNFWFNDCNQLASVEGTEYLNASEVTTSDLMFNGCNSLTSVSLPGDLTTIGYQAFANCRNLTSISIPNNVTLIGNYAFQFCYSLTSVNIPESVQTVSDFAFEECRNLTEPLYNSKLFVFLPISTEGSYTIPDGITSIAPTAFLSCGNLTSVSIPESVTTIGNNAFTNCSQLANLNFPESVTSIGVHVFEGCTSLKTPLFNSKLFVFMPVSAEGSYTVPEGITTIAITAFMNCSLLTNIILSEGVTTIGEGAFQNCKALARVTFPASTEYIDANAFDDCISLTEIYVNSTTPPTLEGWYPLGNPFKGIIYVPSASVNAYKTALSWSNYADNIMDNQPRVNWATGVNTENWSVTAGGVAITPGETAVTAGTTVMVEYAGTRTVDLKAAVALQRQDNKWTFEMPESPVTLNPIIGESSVNGKLYNSFQEALNQVQYGDTVKLEYDAVLTNNLYLFEEMTIDLNGYAISAADNIHFYAPPYNKLTIIDTSIEQGGGVKVKFEKESYHTDRTLRLALMAGRYIYTADEINTNNYNGYGAIAENINVDGSPDADGYISKMHRTKIGYAQWDATTNTLTFMYDFDKPASDAWNLNEGTNWPQWLNTVSNTLTKVVFDPSFADARPASFYYWFYNCRQLTSVEGTEYLNASEVTNSEQMFYNCRALTRVTLPENLAVIGKYAFYNCNALTSVNIPESITTVGDFPFENCSNLTEPLYNSKLFVYLSPRTEGSYTVPNGITTIAAAAFLYCRNLTSVSIPETVTTIGNNAFYYCGQLTTLNIPESVTTVGRHVFEGCGNLNGPLYNSKVFVYMPANAKGSYTVPEGITTIAKTAFLDCSLLNSITLPNEITAINERAFQNCATLASIILPANTAFIGEDAFENCNTLTDVYANPTNPPTLEGWNTFGYSFNGKIYVPLASVDAYKAAERWSNYADRIVDNQPRVNWATGVNTENWSVTAGGAAITPGETAVTAGTTVMVEYTGTRNVDLTAAVALQRQDNKWTFEMPALPVTLNPIIGESSVKGKLYNSFQEALNHVQYGDTVKLEYDVVLTGVDMWVPDGITIDLSGYAISSPNNDAHLYVYPWSKTTVIDSSEEQKGGMKMKFELESYYSSDTKLKLALVAGRYVYTADEINNNGYNGRGAIAENINVDGSPDADGYISVMRRTKVAYAQWNAETTTLTFKYDFDKPASDAWNLNEGKDNPQWLNTVRSTLTKVVFDPSFADARPTSFYYWFYNCRQLTSVEGTEYLNASEVTYSDYMFNSCSALTNVSLPNDLTVIDNNAFSYCTELTSINIPESVTTIGTQTFMGCSKLTEPLYNSKIFVFLPTSTEGSYTIPNGITTIAPSAFQNCNRLTSVSIPEGVTTIGDRAFQNCWRMTDVNIPESVISVGSFVFNSCSALNDTLYNSKLFVYMPTRAAGSYVVPEGIKTIAPSAFQYCSYMTNITLPEGLTTIGAYAFSYCKVLESITLPASTEYVGDYAFENLATLDVYANPTTPPLGARDLFGYATYNGKIYVPLASVDAYKTADYNTAAYWYRYADNIMDNQPRVNWARGANTENWTVTAGGTAITPGETIVAAGTTVTVEYTGTRTVDLKAAVTMERQGNKWTFAMPELPLTLRPIIGVASVGGELYSSFPEALSQAQYNDTVKLEYDVVMSGGYYMPKTTIIDLNGYTISAADDYAHLYLYPYYQVTVIDSSEEQKGGIKMKFELPTNYSSDTKFNLALMGGRYVYTADEINTNGYNGRGAIAENINVDGSPDADGYISRLIQTKVAYAQWDSETTTLTFKYDMDKPESNAWDLNEGTNQPQWLNTVRSTLKKVVFDSSFAEARPTTFYYWFYNCRSLESVEGIEYLKASEVTNSDYMFYNCRVLTSVSIPDDLAIIGRYAFNGCNILTSVNIPESVTTVGERAFYNTLIGEPLYNSKIFVFLPQSTQGSYTIPNGITTIAASAFQNCSQLTEVSIPESVTTIGNRAFQSCWSMTDINIPESLTTIGTDVFNSCSSLNDTLFNSKLFVYMPTSAKGSYVVPEGITTIAPCAFRNCSYLTNIILPEGLTTIGEYAFGTCKVLESVTLPASTEYIGDYAFENLSTLDVYANCTTPPTLGGWNIFGYGDFSGKIYVPLASVDAYKAAEKWSNYADNIMDNQPRVNWAKGANTENWTVTAGGETITPGETIITAGTTVTVEYTGTRTVDLKAAVTMERQGNKWTFAMPELPLTLRPIIGVASVRGELYTSFQEALSLAQYNDTVKLEYDGVISGGYYLSNEITIDLNGYAISANGDNAHFYVYPYNKLTVIDSSEEQKGGVKMKFELPSYYSSDTKFNLALMAGRYVYTADEINSNGYYSYGFIGENINADGSPDADGYISKLRAMTADEKGQAAYGINKTTFKFTLEGVGSTEMAVVKNQEIRLTPPAGWKFGKVTRQGNEYYGGSWNETTYVIHYSNVIDGLGELVANLVPNPEKLVDQLEGITLTLSDDKTSVSLKGAGGKTVILYSENGATLMSQQVEMYKLATFKGLTTGKTYYIGVNDKLIKVDTNL